MKVLGNHLEVLRDHTHGPEQHKVSALKALQAMKTRAQTTDEAPQQILIANLGGLSEGTAAYLPDIPVVRQNIRKQRQKAGNPLPIPQSREYIPVPLPDRYTTTSAGRNFLLYNSQDANRILVFGTDGSLQLLEKNEHWLMDGTFKTVPPLFLQLYTIHALVEVGVIPAVYALLPTNSSQHIAACLLHYSA